jgi:hypothetical protein
VCGVRIRLFRQSYNAAAYFDYGVRLCVIDGDLAGVQEAEVKVHGIHSQLEMRFLAVSQVLQTLKKVETSASKYKDKDDPECRDHSEPTTSSSKNAEIEGCLKSIEELMTKATQCAAYVSLVFSSSSNVAWRLCGDTVGVLSCIRAGNELIPMLTARSEKLDPWIVLEVLSHQLDLQTSTILHGENSDLVSFGVIGKESASDSSFAFSRFHPAQMSAEGEGGDEASSSSSTSNSRPSEAIAARHVELRILAFALGGQLIRQFRKCFSGSMEILSGPNALAHLEIAFRVYTSIFLASLALEESDLLSAHGYTVEKLLGATNDVLLSISERINRQTCAPVGAQTLISLHLLAEVCVFRATK